jgi:hypothetical protein
VDALSFLAKFFDVTARVGAAFALAAAILYFGRVAGVEFFKGLDPVLYQTIVVAGIVGACTIVVEMSVALGKSFSRWLKERVERRRESTEALENIQTLDKNHLLLLYRTLAGSQRRFDVSRNNPEGRELVRKKIFVTVIDSLIGRTCEVNPAIFAERQRLLPVLKQACDTPGRLPIVQRQAAGWTVAGDLAERARATR